jgi:hypothetical protein
MPAKSAVVKRNVESAIPVTTRMMCPSRLRLKRMIVSSCLAAAERLPTAPVRAVTRTASIAHFLAQTIL